MPGFCDQPFKLWITIISVLVDGFTEIVNFLLNIFQIISICQSGMLTTNKCTNLFCIEIGSILKCIPSFRHFRNSFFRPLHYCWQSF